MADVHTDAPVTHGRRRSLRPIRLDMTPLVDLAFLLLSFFVITTTMRHQQVMNLTFPAIGKGIEDKNMLTFLLARRDQCFVYRGTFDKYTTHLEHLDRGQVRMLLSEVQRKPPVCVVKPYNTAKYGAVIDLIDEFEVNSISHYAVSDSLVGDELTMLEQKLRAAGY